MTIPDVPFRSSDLVALGLTRSRLRALIRSGRVRRLVHGVYAPASLPDTLALRAAAIRLVTPDHVVVADGTAAWVLGVDVRDPADLDRLAVPEVVSLRGHEPTRRGDVLGGKRDLSPDEVMVVDGLRLTTPVRTACDLGCRQGRYAAYAALNALARECGLSREDLRRQSERFAGRRGVVQLRELIELVDPRLESPGESWTMLAIIDAGLPAPTPQHWTWLPGIGRVRLDLAFRGHRILVEYDGEEFHSSDEQRAADSRRRRALRDAGWHVIVVRKHQLAGPELDGWLSELREVLEERRRPVKRIYPRGVRRGA